MRLAAPSCHHNRRDKSLRLSRSRCPRQLLHLELSILQQAHEAAPRAGRLCRLPTGELNRLKHPLVAQKFRGFENRPLPEGRGAMNQMMSELLPTAPVLRDLHSGWLVSTCCHTTVLSLHTFGRGQARRVRISGRFADQARPRGLQPNVGLLGAKNKIEIWVDGMYFSEGECLMPFARI
jgi:hypothetical protein